MCQNLALFTVNDYRKHQNGHCDADWWQTGVHVHIDFCVATAYLCIESCCAVSAQWDLSGRLLRTVCYACVCM